MKPSEQLLLALREDTSEEVLTKLWKTSRSVNVRKAVAKNPNSSPLVLQEASRLYLEEVLENPGFSMLQLFSEDPWVQKISECYSDPESFLASTNYYLSRSGDVVDQYCWAILLSPQLTGQSLNRAVQCISSTKLKRAFKNPKVVLKVKTLYALALKSAKEVWPFDLETLLILYREEVINNDYLFEGLSNYGTASTSCKKSSFSKFLNKTIGAYEAKETSDEPRLLAKLLLVCRAHVLYWMPYTSSVTDKRTGELYVKVLRCMLNAPKAKVLTSEHLKVVGSIVANYLRGFYLNAGDSKKFIQDYSKETITNTFNFLASNNLLDAKLCTYGLSLSNKAAVAALATCSAEVKEFFIRAGCLGAWASATGNDAKYQIINEINEAIYEREGITNNLLFLSCSIRKIISLDESTHIF